MDGISTSVAENKSAPAFSMDRIRAILSAGPASEPVADEPATEPAETEPAETETVEEPASEEAAEPAPEPAPAVETMTASEKAKYAKLLVDNERLQADFLRLKKQVEGKSGIDALAEKVRGGDKAAALELLRELGTEFDDLGEAVLKDEKLRKPASAETPEQKRIRELEEKYAKIERDKQELEAKQIFDQEIKLINDTLDADSPLKSLPWAAGEVHKRYYDKYKTTQKLPDLKEVIADVESTFTGDVAKASNVRLFKSLLSDKTKVDAILAVPELKQMFVEALASTEKPAQAQQGKTGAKPKGGPSALTRSNASEVPGRKPETPPTKEELRQRAVNALISNLPGGNK